MAKSSEDLVERLRMGGLRRKVAETVAGGVAGDRGGRKPPTAAKRSAAAKQAARTRARHQ